MHQITGRRRLAQFVPSSSFLLATALFSATSSHAQDKPYFVTYSHDLEEPGNLEIETKTNVAQPYGGNRYGATAVELEYGTRAWWTTELYLDGQATGGDSTIFTGWRLENRIRPLMRDHAINPVLYIEYEDTSGADKTILEFVGHDSQADLVAPNADLRKDHQHEAELKLILSSNLHDWNISENFISEKDLGHAPWEFGYAARQPRRPFAARGRERWRESHLLCSVVHGPGLSAYGGPSQNRPCPRPFATLPSTSRQCWAGNCQRASASAFLPDSA